MRECESPDVALIRATPDQSRALSRRADTSICAKQGRAQLSRYCSRPGVPMPDYLQVLAELQVEVDDCRSLARELKAYKTLSRLDKLADDLARYARRLLARRHRDDGVVAGSSPRKLH